MFATELKADSIDLLLFRNVGRWVALAWRNDLFAPPMGVPYGTHLASYILALPELEIRAINACWIVQTPSGLFLRACDPPQGIGPIGTLWNFRYETLKKFPITELTEAQIDALRLHEIPTLEPTATNPTIKTFRSLRHLDQFRHPGYPDDVSVAYGDHIHPPEHPEVTIPGEQLWVKVARLTDETSFTGTLLNQPQIYQGSKGDMVLVRYTATKGAETLVCPALPRVPTESCNPTEQPSKRGNIFHADKASVTSTTNEKPIGPILFVVERDEVEAGDTSRTAQFLQSFLATNASSRANFQNLDISFSGYDEDTRDLRHIPEVRAFVEKLDADFPYWLYFMHLGFGGLRAITGCLAPPHKDEGASVIHDWIVALLRRRWLPALSDLGTRTGMSQVELELTTVQCLNYLTEGQQNPPELN